MNRKLIEAPEKIYLSPTGYEYGAWTTEKDLPETDIEYIRADKYAELELLNKEKVHYFEELQKAQSAIKELECKYACDRRDSTERCNMDCSRNSDAEKDLFKAKK